MRAGGLIQALDYTRGTEVSCIYSSSFTHVPLQTQFYVGAVNIRDQIKNCLVDFVMSAKYRRTVIGGGQLLQCIYILFFIWHMLLYISKKASSDTPWELSTFLRNPMMAALCWPWDLNQQPPYNRQSILTHHKPIPQKAFSRSETRTPEPVPYPLYQKGSSTPCVPPLPNPSYLIAKV